MHSWNRLVYNFGAWPFSQNVSWGLPTSLFKNTSLNELRISRCTHEHCGVAFVLLLWMLLLWTPLHGNLCRHYHSEDESSSSLMTDQWSVGMSEPSFGKFMLLNCFLELSYWFLPGVKNPLSAWEVALYYFHLLIIDEIKILYHSCLAFFCVTFVTFLVLFSSFSYWFLIIFNVFRHIFLE